MASKLILSIGLGTLGTPNISTGARIGSMDKNNVFEDVVRARTPTSRVVFEIV